MGTGKLKLVKNKARHTSTLLAKHVGDLHSRFNLRRVIIESDKKGGFRDEKDLEKIHSFVCSDTRIGKLPFWTCLPIEQQQELCKYLKHAVVPYHATEPVTVSVDPQSPNSALYILLCGSAISVQGNVATDELTPMWKKLKSGDTMGGIFVPKFMHEALVLERHKKLRAEWIAARRGPPPTPPVLDSYDNKNTEGGVSQLGDITAETIAWQVQNEEVENEARRMSFESISLDQAYDDEEFEFMEGFEQSCLIHTQDTPNSTNNLKFGNNDFENKQKDKKKKKKKMMKEKKEKEGLAKTPKEKKPLQVINGHVISSDDEEVSGTPLATIHSGLTFIDDLDGASNCSTPREPPPPQMASLAATLALDRDEMDSFKESQGGGVGTQGGEQCEEKGAVEAVDESNYEQDDDDGDDDDSEVDEDEDDDSEDYEDEEDGNDSEQSRRLSEINRARLLKTEKTAQALMGLAEAAHRVAQESSLISAERGGSGRCLGVALSAGSEYLVLNAEDALPIIEEICERSGRNAVLRAVGLRCLLKVVTPHSAPAGHVLGTQAEFTDSVSILVQGECRLVYREKDGSSRQLAVIGPTSIIGDETALLGFRNSATVICSSDVKFLSIPNRCLKRELDMKPELLSWLKISANTKRDWIESATKNEKKKLCWGDGGKLNEVAMALELDGLGGQSAFRGWSELPIEESNLQSFEEAEEFLTDVFPVTEEDSQLNEDDEDDRSSIMGGSALSVATAEVQEEKRLKLVKQMLVRTYDGLDPSAQAIFKPEPWNEREKGTRERSRNPSSDVEGVLRHSHSMPVSRGTNTLPISRRNSGQSNSSNGPNRVAQYNNNVRMVSATHSSSSIPKSQRKHRGVKVGVTNDEGDALLAKIQAELAGELPMAWPIPSPRKMHPLDPFPTLTRNRGLHASKLPFVAKSRGFEIATSIVKKKQSEDFEGEAWKRPHVLAAMPKDVKVKLKAKDMIAIERAVDNGLECLRQHHNHY